MASLDGALERGAADHDFTGFTSHTVTDPERCRQNVRAARALNRWMTDQQLDLGLCGIAMALQSQNFRDRAMVERLLPLLRETAQALRPLL